MVRQKINKQREGNGKQATKVRQKIYKKREGSGTMSHQGRSGLHHQHRHTEEVRKEKACWDEMMEHWIFLDRRIGISWNHNHHHSILVHSLTFNYVSNDKQLNKNAIQHWNRFSRVKWLLRLQQPLKFILKISTTSNPFWVSGTRPSRSLIKYGINRSTSINSNLRHLCLILTETNSFLLKEKKLSWSFNVRC